MLILISCAIHFNLLFTRDTQPSMVDTSKLEVLTIQQIIKFENVVTQLYSNPSIKNFSYERHNHRCVSPRMKHFTDDIHVEFDHECGRMNIYRFIFDYDENQRSVSVSIRIY